jgi:hypothetical protein
MRQLINQLQFMCRGRTLALLVVAASQVLGCSTDVSIAGRAEAQSAKRVGDPCERADGWNPDRIPGPAQQANAASDVARPVLVAVPANFKDYHQADSAARYCLVNPEYPAGYMTGNCKLDQQCGPKGVCHEGMCRRPCSSNAECMAPSTCELNGGIRFCRCPDCVLEGP